MNWDTRQIDRWVEQVEQESSLGQWIAEEVKILLEDELPWSIGIAAGLLYRLPPRAREDRKAMLKQMLGGPLPTQIEDSFEQQWRRWLASLSDTQREHLVAMLSEQIDELHVSIDMMETLPATEEERAIDAKRLAYRRDDLACIHLLLSRMRHPALRKLELDLDALDRHAEQLLASLPPLDTLRRDPRLQRIHQLEPEAWWCRLAFPYELDSRDEATTQDVILPVQSDESGVSLAKPINSMGFWDGKTSLLDVWPLSPTTRNLIQGTTQAKSASKRFYDDRDFSLEVNASGQLCLLPAVGFHGKEVLLTFAQEHRIWLEDGEGEVLLLQDASRFASLEAVAKQCQLTTSRLQENIEKALKREDWSQVEERLGKPDEIWPADLKVLCQLALGQYKDFSLSSSPQKIHPLTMRLMFLAYECLLKRGIQGLEGLLVETLKARFPSLPNPLHVVQQLFAPDTQVHRRKVAFPLLPSEGSDSKGSLAHAYVIRLTDVPTNLYFSPLPLDEAGLENIKQYANTSFACFCDSASFSGLSYTLALAVGLGDGTHSVSQELLSKFAFTGEVTPKGEVKEVKLEVNSATSLVTKEAIASAEGRQLIHHGHLGFKGSEQLGQADVIYDWLASQTLHIPLLIYVDNPNQKPREGSGPDAGLAQLVAGIQEAGVPSCQLEAIHTFLGVGPEFLVARVENGLPPTSVWTDALASVSDQIESLRQAVEPRLTGRALTFHIGVASTAAFPYAIGAMMMGNSRECVVYHHTKHTYYTKVCSFPAARRDAQDDKRKGAPITIDWSEAEQEGPVVVALDVTGHDIDTKVRSYAKNHFGAFGFANIKMVLGDAEKSEELFREHLFEVYAQLKEVLDQAQGPVKLFSASVNATSLCLGLLLGPLQPIDVYHYDPRSEELYHYVYSLSEVTRVRG